MNIFVTDKCPVKSAKYLDNSRVIKMILESVQMLCTALNEFDVFTSYEYTPVKFIKGNIKIGKSTKLAYYHNLTKVYAPTHKNHPCNVWVRQSRSNWLWLFNHTVALCNEYTLRYNKIHKSESLLPLLNSLVSKVPEGPLTDFVNCAAHQGLGLDFKLIQPTTEAYKLYLTERWKTDKKEPKWS